MQPSHMPTLRSRRVVSLSAWRHLFVVLCVAGVLTPWPVGAEPARGLSGFSVTNWGETDGPLPYGVYDIAQDQQGFIWLAGRLGVIRFDGLSFTLWNDRVRLREERISTIHISDDDSIWIGFATSEGLARISTDRSSATRYGSDAGLSVGYVRAIVEDQHGMIWVGGYGGLAQFRDDQWHMVTEQSGLPATSTQSIYADRQGTIWVATSNGIFSRSTDASTFTLFSTDLASALAEDPEGVMWIAEQQTVFKPLNLAKRAGASSDWTVGAGRGTDLLVDRGGDVWVATGGGGLIRRRRSTADSAVLIERLNRAENGLVNDYVHSLFQDRDGRIWVGTRGGLSRLTETSIAPMQGLLAGEDPYVYSVLSSIDGTLWMGTGGGAIQIIGDKVRHYTETDGLPGRVVTAFYQDAAGTLWTATTNGMARLTGRRFGSIKNGEEPLRVGLITSLTVDKQGRLWMCDARLGLLRWNDGRVDHIDRDFRRGPPNVAYTDHQGRVWIGYLGSESGLDVYDGNIRTTYSTANGLPDGGVNAIFQDSRNAVWVGTASGIAVFDNVGHFQSLASTGLPPGAVTSIIEDAEHYLWFGLGTNLFRLPLSDLDTANPQTSQLPHRRFGPEDGLSQGLGRTGTPNVVLRPGGDLVFLTASGPVSVRPNHLKPPVKSGPPRVEKIFADGIEFSSPVRLELAPHTARIEINYSTLSLGPSAGLSFRYKLDGFDNDWQDSGQRRQAIYMNLRPGNYIFRLASSTGDGVWNEANQPVGFSIERAFYQTRLFYGVCAILLSATIVIGWHLRLRIFKARFNSVLAERVRVAQDLHDTLLQSLVAAALDFDDISSQLDSAAGDLRDQVNLMREKTEHYIRETRLSIWQLRSPLLETEGLAGAVRRHGNLVTSGSSTRFLSYQRGTPVPIPKDVEQQILRIAQEAVMNAIRHASPHTITAELLYGEEHVTLRVSDDGKGFEPEHIGIDGHDHWGLVTMKERAERIDATFTLVSYRGSGATIEVVVPLPAKG